MQDAFLRQSIYSQKTIQQGIIIPNNYNIDRLW